MGLNLRAVEKSRFKHHHIPLDADSSPLEVFLLEDCNHVEDHVSTLCFTTWEVNCEREKRAYVRVSSVAITILNSFVTKKGTLANHNRRVGTSGRTYSLRILLISFPALQPECVRMSPNFSSTAWRRRSATSSVRRETLNVPFRKGSQIFF